MTTLRAQSSGICTSESVKQLDEESSRWFLVVQEMCAMDGKVALPVVTGVAAYRCIGPEDPNFLAAQRAVQYLEATKECKESFEVYERIQKLQADYHAAQVECARSGRAVLVTSTTPGQHARFDCVSRDDPKYKAQHVGEPLPPAPPTDLDSRLKPRIGQNVTSVVALLGGPQGEPIVDGDVVYEWSYATHYQLRDSLVVNDSRTKSCKLNLVTDPSTRVVKRYDWTEQRGGCAVYAQKLDVPAHSPSPQ